MLENDYNPVVTKNELIDILYENFQNLITKVDLERIMDDIIKLEDENSKIYSLLTHHVDFHHPYTFHK